MDAQDDYTEMQQAEDAYRAGWNDARFDRGRHDLAWQDGESRRKYALGYEDGKSIENP